MMLANDNTNPDHDCTPIVLGGTGGQVNSNGDAVGEFTEIYRPDSGGWAQYEYLNYNTWNTFGCLTALGKTAFSIMPSSGVVELDTVTWTFQEKGSEVPEFLLPVPKCSPAVIDGQLGKGSTCTYSTYSYTRHSHTVKKLFLILCHFLHYTYIRHSILLFLASFQA